MTTSRAVTRKSSRAVTGMRLTRRRALLVAAALLLLWPPFAWLAAGWLVLNSEPARSDVLVVLGGSSTYEERTEYAAELFREGLAPKVVLTDDGQRGGWSPEEQRNPFFVERAAAVLERAGVPAERIETLQPPTSSTYEEALLLREYAAAHDVHGLLVVTSGYHSRRARWTLERVFRGSPVSVALTAVPPGRQTPAPAFWWLRGAGWQMVALEYLKLAYYRVRYR